MKKRSQWFARIAAVVLAGTMVFTFAAATKPTEVYAAEDTVITGDTTTGSLTISKTDDSQNKLPGAGFTLYQVMSIEIVENRAVYTPQAPFAEVLEQNGVEPDDLGTYSSTQLDALIAKLTPVTGSDADAVTMELTGDDGTATEEGLPLGYYLVVETTTPAGYTAGNPFLVSIPSPDNYNQENAAGTKWVYDVTAEPKNAQVSLDKVINEGDGKTTDTVAVGDYVPYKITTKLQNYEDAVYAGDQVTFTISDEMKGLVFVEDVDHPVSVKVNGTEVENTGSSAYTVTPAAENKGFTLAFTQDYLKANRAFPVEITYYGQVTEEAVTLGNYGENKATLEYNTSPAETTEGDPIQTYVYTFGIQTVKFTTDGGEQALAGAKFGLYEEKACQTLIGEIQTSDGSGLVNFTGLDEGTYYLKETESPDGYTLLANPIEIVIDSAGDNGEFTLKINGSSITTEEGTFVSRIDKTGRIAVVAVENHEGFKLPATGGIGIGLFLVIGIAGITLLIVGMKKKMKEQE